MYRGVIASPALFEVDTDKDMFSLKRGLTPEEIRYYALYWDKVTIPTNNIMNVRVSEEAVLLETGVITRPIVTIVGQFGAAGIGDSLAIAQAETAKNLIGSASDTDWVLHQVGPSFSLPEKFQTQQRSLRFDLYNALPVPSSDVHIEEVLEFKLRRKDQLNILHNSLDELYIQILNSGDPELVSLKEVANLKTAIEELNQVTNERWKQTRKYDFSAQLNLDGGKLATSIASGALYDAYLNPTDYPIGALAGGLLSLFRLQAKVSSTFEPAKNQTSLGYLSQACKDKIIV